MLAVTDRRMEILNACIKVFSKKGYYKATIEDIASQAEIGKGTVYLYFSGKEELFEEMIKYMLDGYYESVSSILSTDESINERIVNLIGLYRQNIKERIDLIQNLIGEYNPMLSDKVKIIFKQNRENLNTVLSSFMEDGIKRCEIRKDIDQYIASLSIFSIIGHYYLDKIHGEELEIDQVDDAPLIEFLINMLK